VFELLVQDQHSKAQCGQLTTAHGVIETPAFMQAPANLSAFRLQPITLAIAARSVGIGLGTVFEISNDLSGKNRGKIFLGRRRETECSDGLDRRLECRLARHHIAG
jgi:hypothetical protein